MNELLLELCDILEKMMLEYNARVSTYEQLCSLRNKIKSCPTLTTPLSCELVYVDRDKEL